VFLWGSFITESVFGFIVNQDSDSEEYNTEPKLSQSLKSEAREQPA